MFLVVDTRNILKDEYLWIDLLEMSDEVPYAVPRVAFTLTPIAAHVALAEWLAGGRAPDQQGGLTREAHPLEVSLDRSEAVVDVGLDCVSVRVDAAHPKTELSQPPGGSSTTAEQIQRFHETTSTTIGMPLWAALAIVSAVPRLWPSHTAMR